jgi:hypothetical protein
MLISSFERGKLNLSDYLERTIFYRPLARRVLDLLLQLLEVTSQVVKGMLFLTEKLQLSVFLKRRFLHTSSDVRQFE